MALRMGFTPKLMTNLQILWNCSDGEKMTLKKYLTKLCTYVRTYVCMYVCMYVYMYVCMYVSMYVSMYVCMCRYWEVVDFRL